MKLYLKAIGVSISITKGLQGVFIIQCCPLVGRHLHREIRGAQWPGNEEEDEGQGRFTHLLKPPLPPGSKIPNSSEAAEHYTEPEDGYGSKEGRSQELSKARTRLTFPRGRVVQPPLQPGIKPDPPPPCSGESDPSVPGNPVVPGTWERLAAEKMAFLPDTPGSLTLNPRSVNPAHPETAGEVPASTQRRQHQEFQLWMGSLPAPCPPGIILCRCPALISSPAEKQGKSHGLAAGPYRAAAAASFPLALPCHPARLSLDGANNPPLPSEGLSTPKSTLTLPPMARAAPLRALHPQSAQGGGLNSSGCPHPAAINPKGMS